MIFNNNPIFSLHTKGASGKEIVVVLSRQHPPEVTGYSAMQYFVNKVLDESALSKKFLERFEMIVIPTVNPDGVDQGHWRHNMAGVDLNRDWELFKQPETKAIRDYMVNTLKKQDAKIYFAIDFHSTWNDVFYTNTDDQRSNAPGFVNANAKIWGQKTSDQKYATVYNPSEFRWPLAVSVSDDGLNYKNLLLVNGEITSLRYGGAYKSYGPQYVRGIQEMDGTPPDNNMWVTYSMNKEDIWVSKIPVPIESIATKEVNDNFEILDKVHALDAWNIYAPLLCTSSIENINNKNSLVISDADPFDYAKVERVFPASSNKEISFSLTAGQQDFGNLEIELVNGKGLPCVRILLDSTGAITTKQGYRLKSLGKYTSQSRLDITLTCNTKTRMYTVSINGAKPTTNLFFAPVSDVERLVFRTGSTRRFPDADTPTDQAYDLQQPNLIGKKAVYLIHNVTTKSL